MTEWLKASMKSLGLWGAGEPRSDGQVDSLSAREAADSRGQIRHLLDESSSTSVVRVAQEKMQSVSSSVRELPVRDPILAGGWARACHARACGGAGGALSRRGMCGECMQALAAWAVTDLVHRTGSVLER